MKKKKGTGKEKEKCQQIIIQKTVSDNLKVLHSYIEKTKKKTKFCRPFDSPIYMFPALEKQKTEGLWKERGYS